MVWHSKKIEEIIELFGSDINKGLTTSQVKELRVKYGANTLASQKQKSNWLLLLEQFNDPLIYILTVAAILNALISDLKDTLVIIAVVILNTVIGFIQERRANDALKSLNKMAAPIARVLRNGEQVLIPTSEVVCGDIIILESGMRVPADARLIESNNLVIDESMLTGESFAVAKNHKVKLDEETQLGDRVNYVYSGTIIQKGRGLAIVTAVGKNTEFGKISEKVAEAVETTSPLQNQMERFSKVLSVTILASVAAIFIVGFLRGNDIVTMFLTSVGLAVSAIPEGLLVAVTVTLSIGVSQMAKHNAVVKKLAAVETLGSTNVICTDKTGTLTKNQMTVTRLWTGCEEYRVTGSGYDKDGKVYSVKDNKEVSYNINLPLKLTSLLSLTCTESTISDDGDVWKITGDPTEAAIMIVSKKLGLDVKDVKFVVDIPFESENQLMAVRTFIEDEAYLFAKGAPEQIINRCKNMLACDGTLKPINKEELNKIISNFSADGLRVLAFACSTENIDEKASIETLRDLTFLGFAGIEDAVRPEAVKAVSECKSAGIKVVMITGDHVKTAKAIAKSVGIGHAGTGPNAISGRELDLMNDDELFDKVPEIDVYARVAPFHKYRIVEQLQKHSNVVAMTGDGVNDAPALKKADIGVAMGSGTDVARDASHMILMDDNFATIVHAIRRGRIILHNLQHILLYILATSFGGLLTIAMSVAIGLPLPVLPAQLLWINLVTDGTSTFPLAFEKEHGDVMAFPPRKKNKPLVTKKMVARIGFAGIIMMLGTLGLFVFYLDDTFNPSPESLSKARTIAFSALAFFQIWNVQNSRSVDRSLFFNLPFSRNNKLDRVSPLHNPILLGVMLLAILLQLGAVTLPFMNMLMNTVPLNMQDWIYLLGGTFTIIIFIEIEKFIRALINKLKRMKAGIEMDEEMI